MREDLKFEETDTHLVFREVTGVREIAQKYSDGVIVKTADEIQKMDEYDKEHNYIQLLFDSHSKGHPSERVVGFVLPPKAIPSYQHGKLKRSFFFEKEVLTQDEIAGLRNITSSDKKDVSIGFDDKTKYVKDDPVLSLWNGQKVDGYSEEMKIDHWAWVPLGRCSTLEGCGLVRSDESTDGHRTGTRRVDAVNVIKEEYTVIQGQEKEDKDYSDSCVSRKVSIFKNEHPEWEHDKVVAAAINYCKNIKKTDEKDMSNEPREDKEQVFLKEGQKEIIETLEEQEKAEASRKKDKSDLILDKLDSLIDYLRSDKFPPKEKEEKEKEEPEEEKEKEKKKKDCAESESREDKDEITKLQERLDNLEKSKDSTLQERIDFLEKENKELIERNDEWSTGQRRRIRSVAHLEEKERLEKLKQEQENK